MGISTKKIISFISQKKDKFTRDEIINTLLKTSQYKGKIKKKKQASDKKDSSKINNLLDILTGSKLLTRNKNRYSVTVKNFMLTGKISINSSGNAILYHNIYGDIIVKRLQLGNARDKDSVNIQIVNYKQGQFFGQVVDISNRDKKNILVQVKRKTKDFIFFSQINYKSDETYYTKRYEKEPDDGDLILIKPLEKYNNRKQQCKVIQIFKEDDESSDFNRVTLKHELPSDHKDYAELAESQNIIDKEKTPDRKDYSKLFTVTIDGEHSKDFDDAISVKKLKNKIRLYVHIADVSAYVKVKGPLDMEALKRGTSYYLGNKVIPMLPENLSNELCSLKAGIPRLTLTAELTYSPSGELLTYSFHKGIIKVNKRLTYNSAEKILSRKSLSREYGTLKTMYALSRQLFKQRLKKGRLDLNLTDVELVYDGDHVKNIATTTRLKSHSIIEELMLSANEAAATFLKNNKMPSLFRNHESISPEKLFAMKSFLQLFGIGIKKNSKIGIAVQNILKDLKGKKNEKVINLAILKSLMQADYSPEPLGHFGLGFENYTHFTSPIRRYPDLIVHRCIKSLIELKKSPYTTEELIVIGEKSSTLERIAQKAERDLIKIKSCRLLKDRIGETFEATINGVTKFGMFITLDKIPIEGMVPLKNLTDDYYLVSENEFSVNGKRYGKRFTLGDSVKVKLVTVDLNLMRIDFDIA